MVENLTRRAGSIAAIACLALTLASVAVAASPAAKASPAHATHHTVALSSLEHGVLADINAIRVQHNLVPLRLSAPLGASAREHSAEMAAKGYFAHESADGSAFWQRIQRVYPRGPFGTWSVGENLLWSSPGVDPAGALKLWMNSPEHRKNLLSPDWREIGVSALSVVHAPGAYEGLDVTILTTDFGVRH